MKTSPDCIPCFHRQVRQAAVLSTACKELQETIIKESEELVESFDHDLSPPENATSLYQKIAELSDNPDIFSGLKRSSNRTALAMQDELANIITRSDTPLETAAKLAIAGNIIDYGSQQEFNVAQTVRNSLSETLAVNDLETLRADLENAQEVLYLGDNCGELVFDRLFIETIGKSVTFSVKEKAIINDALLKDAIECGLDKVCRIISNGTGCPGTPLEACNAEFRETFQQADLIISKGQGNFETLSENPGPIYFLLMVKCPVVARHVSELSCPSRKRVKQGDLILMRNRRV